MNPPRFGITTKRPAFVFNGCTRPARALQKETGTPEMGPLDSASPTAQARGAIGG